MDDQANIDFIKEFYDAYLQGDRERLLSCMAPDIEWDIPSMPGIPFSGKRRGREQVNEFFRLVGESQQLVRFEPRDFVSQCGRVYVTGRNDWKVKATGAGFSTDWVHIFTVKDRQVTGFRQFMDTHAIVTAYRSDAPSDPDSLPSAHCPALH
ncbi:MAG TPA: nuclear transport factor 2 family protein [Telluria sp.]|nr:nuclear transport factor 2 family protein [Telluria sp.]